MNNDSNIYLDNTKLVNVNCQLYKMSCISWYLILTLCAKEYQIILDSAHETLRSGFASFILGALSNWNYIWYIYILYFHTGYGWFFDINLVQERPKIRVLNFNTYRQLISEWLNLSIKGLDLGEVANVSHHRQRAS